jgi:PAS domain S-box-containing protein
MPLKGFRGQRSTLFALSGAIAVSMLVGLVVLMSVQTSIRTVRWVSHTHEVEEYVQRLSASMEHASNARKGYALTHSDEFRKQYEESAADVRASEAQLRTLMADNVSQRVQLATVSALIEPALQRMKASIEDPAQQSRPYGSPEAATQMAAIRRGIGAMAEQEDRLEAQREQEAHRTARLAMFTVIFGSLPAALIICVCAIRLSAEIARRRRSERILAQTNAALQTLFRSAPLAIYTLDRHGWVLTWNAAAEKLFGIPASEAVGRPLSIVPDDLVVEEKQGRDQLCAGAAPVYVETERITSQGKRVPVALCMSGLAASTDTDESGEEARIIAIAQDISERRAIERMKDEFVSVVSHELRTPLTSIRGSLGLLASGKLGDMAPAADRMLQIASSNTDRLVRLTNDILDIERMRSGRLTFSRKNLSVRALATAAIDSLRALAEEKNLRVRFEGEDASVWADEDRSIQCITNLLSNAIKFSSAGSEVVVQCARSDQAVQISVHDHGRGIPQEMLERIFARFEQVDASDSREKGGSGLGLAICKAIVAQQGGRIWAESVLGEGSTVRFTLPSAENEPIYATTGSDGARA